MIKKAINRADDLFAQNILDNCHNGDAEYDHTKADVILLDLLRQLGFEKVCKAWEDVTKWYA